MYCGGALSPPGDPDTRYFCSGGQVVGIAACPYGCDPTKDLCYENGGGPTFGSSIGEGLACSDCMNNSGCTFSACLTDSNCALLSRCLQSCDDSAACGMVCSQAFPDGCTLLLPVVDCVRSSCRSDCRSSRAFLSACR